MRVHAIVSIESTRGRVTRQRQKEQRDGEWIHAWCPKGLRVQEDVQRERGKRNSAMVSGFTHGVHESTRGRATRKRRKEQRDGGWIHARCPKRGHNHRVDRFPQRTTERQIVKLSDEPTPLVVAAWRTGWWWRGVASALNLRCEGLESAVARLASGIPECCA